jgi:hypothetical protein
MSESSPRISLTMFHETVKIMRASPGADAVQMFLSEATRRIDSKTERPWSASGALVFARTLADVECRFVDF